MIVERTFLVASTDEGDASSIRLWLQALNAVRWGVVVAFELLQPRLPFSGVSARGRRASGHLVQLRTKLGVSKPHLVVRFQTPCAYTQPKIVAASLPSGCTISLAVRRSSSCKVRGPRLVRVSLRSFWICQQGHNLLSYNLTWFRSAYSLVLNVRAFFTSGLGLSLGLTS